MASLAAACTFGLLALPAAHSLAKPPVIAFVTDRDAPGSLEIQSVGADGKNLTRLTRHSPGGRDPAWSPSGRTIAFTAPNDRYAVSSPEGVWLMNADGGHPRRLVAGGATPSWSPDGLKIAFVRNGDLWVVRRDGAGATRLTKLDALEDQAVSWSPKGNRIAFIGSFGGGVGDFLYVVNTDGRKLRRLTARQTAADLRDEEPLYDPEWSPDGRKIAVVDGYTGDEPPGSISIVDVSTRVRRTLVHGAEPAWSPDGKWLAFSDKHGLGAIRPDGAGLRRLADTAGAEFAPAWASPRRVLFASAHKRLIRLYVTEIARPRPRRLTKQAAFVSRRVVRKDQRWSPDGRIFLSAVTFAPSVPDEILAFRVGGSLRVLTPVIRDSHVSWSPDGQSIAFARRSLDELRRGRRVRSVIMVSQVGATAERRLAEGSAPAWSPSRGAILFVRASSIFVVNTDGSGETKLHAGIEPAWSPDGDRIAFAGSSGVFVMNPDGNGVRLVSKNERFRCADDGSTVVELRHDPSWSPDGRKILYENDRPGEDGCGPLLPSLEVSSADGGATRRVAVLGSHGAWSPDGEKIIFDGLTLVGADGRGLNRLGTDGVRPAWSPDGTKIVFVDRRTSALSSINADGTGKVRLASTPVPVNENPEVDWQPMR